MIRKALFTLFALCFLGALPALAQDSQVITLNDGNPSIDAMITLPPDTTGVASLELSAAAVTVTDNAGNIVFQLNDPRAHGVELRFAPNSGPYTLSVTRLPGMPEAQVILRSLPELTDTTSGTLVQDGPLGPMQERDFRLTAASPISGVPLTIPEGSIGVITSSFPGAPVEQQLVDSNGMPVAVTSGSGIDAVSLALDPGTYQMTLRNTDASRETTASVHIMPTSAVNLGTALAAPVTQLADTSAPSCTGTIQVSSLNVRSGPGTGYSVLGYGFRDESYPVGGTNPDGSWVLLGTNVGSAWVSNNYVQRDGDCSSLPVYNIPFRSAPAPEVIILPAPPATVIQQPAPSQSFSGGGSGGGDDDSGEHESEHEDD